MANVQSNKDYAMMLREKDLDRTQVAWEREVAIKAWEQHIAVREDEETPEERAMRLEFEYDRMQEFIADDPQPTPEEETEMYLIYKNI